MIDKKIFLTGMTLLADRFNRALAGPTQAKYFTTLNAELTNEEFEAAVEIAFRDCTFWPSPKELIEAVHPPADAELEAARVFDRIQKLGEWTRGGMSYDSEEIREKFGDVGVIAFEAIGATQRLRNLTDDDMSWCRREFIAAYRSAKTEEHRRLTASRALAPAGSTLRLSAGSSR